MREKKQGGGLAFLFLVIAILLIFVFDSILGLIFAILSLIFSIKDLKHKNPVVYISLVGSILSILFCIVSIVISTVVVSDVLSEAKLNTYKYYEDSLEMYAQQYVTLKEESFKTDDFVLTAEEILDNTNLKKVDSCEGYVVVNKSSNVYEAYVRCNSYKTDGFDKTLLENNNQDVTNETLKDEEQKESQIDWSNLEVSMNGVQYKYPFKISDFITKGWEAENSEYHSIIYDTVDSSISKGYNYIVIKHNSLLMTVYFDMNNTTAKVLDSNIIRFEVEDTMNDVNNFDFYGIKFGADSSEIVDLLGTKNYELLEDENYNSYRYFNKTSDNYNLSLELQVNKSTNKLTKVIISLI